MFQIATLMGGVGELRDDYMGGGGKINKTKQRCYIDLKHGLYTNKYTLMMTSD